MGNYLAFYTAVKSAQQRERQRETREMKEKKEGLTPVRDTKNQLLTDVALWSTNSPIAGVTVGINQLNILFYGKISFKVCLDLQVFLSRCIISVARRRGPRRPLNPKLLSDKA